MSIFGNPGVEDSVDEGVEELKQHSDDVEVDNLRSPRELIDQVDRLEEIVEGLRERQQRMAENLGDDQEIRFEDNFSESSSSAPDVEKIEGRLNRLEADVDMIEEGLEVDADEMREEIVEEAVKHEAIKFEELRNRIDRIEGMIEDAEIEEKVDKSSLGAKLEDLKNEFDKKLSENQPKVEEELTKIEDRVESLEMAQDKEKTGSTGIHVDEKVGREEFENLRSHVEEISELLKHVVNN